MKNCKFCQKPLTTQYQIFFCNRSCSAKFFNKERIASGWKLSEDSIENIKTTLVKRYENSPNKIAYKLSPKKCKVCNLPMSYDRRWHSTCSNLCYKQMLPTIGRKGGKASAAKQTRRSKHEIEMYNLCKNHFLKVDHNKSIFNGWDADILIYDHKLALLWNGDWHYIEMSFAQSLLQVQTRDAYRIKQIIKAGWKPYIIEDSTKNPKQPKQAFSELLEYISVACSATELQ
jgi:hypothetical protein